MRQKLTLYLYHEEFGEREITEAFQTDAFAYTLEQQKNRFGRDIRIGGEEVSLRFEAVYGIAISAPQTLPDGSIINHLSMGLPYILYYWKATGFETKMELRAKDYLGNTLSVGELDFTEASFKTDGLTYAECKTFWQSTAVQIKRWQEAECDILSETDRVGNPIQPATLYDIFFKALPTPQNSTWHSPDSDIASGQAIITGDEDEQEITRTGSNNAFVTGEYGIERSLGYISGRYALVSGIGGFFPDGGNNFTYIQAANQLSNITVSLSNINAYAQQVALDGVGTTITSATGRVRLVINIGLLPNFNQPRLQYIVDEKNLIYTNPADSPDTQNFDVSYTVNIPLMLRGEYMWIYLETDATAVITGTTTTATYIASGVMETMDVAISAISTAVSSVTKAVKYVSLVEQPLLWINGTPLIAPRLRDGGFMGDVYAYNGSLLRGITDNPFSVTLKDRFERLQAFNLDYQVNDDNVFLGNERDFYPNRELAVFTETPDADYNIETNERATCNIVDLKFTGYLNQNEQDSTEEPTRSAVHTVTQYTTPNERCENILSIDIKDILDPITQEKARKLAITEKPNTTGKYDEKVMLIDTVPIPEGMTWSENVYVQMQIDEDGNLQILNGVVESDQQQYYFDWRTLGFSDGSTFTITEGENAGSYTVLERTFSVLTLSGSPTFEGKAMITMSYLLDNVLLMNRTTEGFAIAVDGFSNQRFTPKRILDLYSETLANICRFHTHSVIMTNKPPINADFTTRLDGEVNLVVESNPVSVNQLRQALITANIINSRVAMTMAQAKQLYTDYSTVFEDGTVGGYITIRAEAGATRRMYLQKSPYLLLTEICELKGEEKYSPFDIDIL